ncbi:MAG: hypothetical protein GY805_36880, partial [Chloroflexi bacterium]|nr:hypothetical protein [Chloroflexota bacterium]
PLWYLQTVEGRRPDVTIEYVVPGEGTYSQTWVNRITEELGNGRSVIATYIDETAYTQLPPAEPVAEALLFRQAPRTELPNNFSAFALHLNDQAQVIGYQLTRTSVEIGLETKLTIAWQANKPVPFFVHLLDESGNIVAQADIIALPQAQGLTLTQFHLTPRRGPGEFTIRLGSGSDFAKIGTLSVTLASMPAATQHPVYRPLAGERPSTTLIGYDWDTTLLGQTRLYLHWKNEAGYWSTTHDNPTTTDLAALLPTVLAPWGLQVNQTIPSAKPNDHYVPLGQGIIWTGKSLYDLQMSLSPDNEYRLPMQFVNGRPLLRDYVVSTRLVGLEEDNFSWAWCDLVDGIPAMGGIPTLKWIQGSQVNAPRTIIFPPRTGPASFTEYCQSDKPAPSAPFLYVDNAATPNQTVSGILRLYDAFTNRPLPILDERITAVYSWIPLGEVEIGE